MNRMALNSDSEPHVLTYRRNKPEEYLRLDTQYRFIEHAILDGETVLSSIHS